MTYAGDRAILDADSHVMELADFLDDFIDPGPGRAAAPRGMDASSPVLDDAVAKAQARRSDPDVSAGGRGAPHGGQGLVRHGRVRPGGAEPGARPARFRRPARLRDLRDGDVLAAAQYPPLHDPVDLDQISISLRRSRRAEPGHGQISAAGDPRLLPGGFVPLVDPERAIACADEAIAAGCAAVMVPSTAAGERSPTHPGPRRVLVPARADRRSLRPARRRRRPAPRPRLPQQRHAGHRPPRRRRERPVEGLPGDPPLAGGVPRRAHLTTASSTAIPGCAAGASSRGRAGWCPGCTTSTTAQRAFRRTEEPLRRLEATPSDYVRRHLKFTPFPGEPVGWMMEQAGAELFMFSTDYPHPEGGRDPLAKFEESLTGTGESDKAGFYAEKHG